MSAEALPPSHADQAASAPSNAEDQQRPLITDPPTPPTTQVDPPESSPPDSPDAIRQNPTLPDTNSSNPLPIFTPNRPQPDLNPRQLTALALLTSGKTISAAASMLGVHRSTLHDWTKIPAFAAELQSRRAELRDTIDARLYRLLLHATHACIASLKVKDLQQSYRNAFRLMSTLRPWMPRIDGLLDHPPKEYADNNRVPPLNE
jgi:hypothetical protein